MKSLFIYYKTGAQHEAEMLSIAPRLFAAVSHATGIQGELLKRTSLPQDDAHTWMEIYREVERPDEFLPILGNLPVFAELHQLITGERHIETFEAI